MTLFHEDFLYQIAQKHVVSQDSTDASYDSVECTNDSSDQRSEFKEVEHFPFMAHYLLTEEEILA